LVKSHLKERESVDGSALMCVETDVKDKEEVSPSRNTYAGR
jgi:hypothetical protein